VPKVPFKLKPETEKLMKLTQAKLTEQAMSPKKFGLPKVVVTAEELGQDERDEILMS